MKTQQSTLTLFLTFCFLIFSLPIFGQCSISNVTASITSCTDDVFDVEINFDYQDVTNQFSIVGNGINYGTFEYVNLPVTLTGLNADCTTSYEFIITDAIENDCTDFTGIGLVCCDEDCVFSDLEVAVDECVGNEFSIEVTFNYTSPSESFVYLVYDDMSNIVMEGIYNYADLPLTLFFDENDSEDFNIVIEDIEFICDASAVFINPCQENAQCEMTIFDFGDDPVCIDGVIVTTWWIVGENISEVGFDIFIDGVFQFFVQYEEDNWYDFELVAPNNGPLDEVFELTVCDNDNPDCCISIDIENPCWEPEECVFSNLVLEPSNCEQGAFDLFIDFDFTGNNNLFFDLFIYDQYNEVVFEDFVEFVDLPLTITISNITSEYFVVSIFENDNDGCNIDGEFMNPCFVEGACEITAIESIEIPICEDGVVVADWYIFGENTGGVGYDIFINNEFLTFVQYSNSDIYYFEFEDPTTEYFTIQACDNDNPNCCFITEYMNTCFESESCFIGEVEATTTECNNAMEFSVTIDFEYQNTGDQFSVVGNGMNYGMFSYLDLPITIDGFSADCETQYEFIINDVDNNDCTNFAGVGPICCESDCFISDLEVETSECDGSEFEIFVSFNYSSTSDFFVFTIYDNNSNVLLTGTYSYSNLPLVLPLDNNSSSYFNVVVQDSENQNCVTDGQIENPCFSEEGCAIFDVWAEVLECQQGFFNVQIGFEHINTSDQFMVNGNGNSYGTFSYADLPIIIYELEADCNTEFEFVIIDIANNDCFGDIDYGTVCCEGDDECEISNLLIETSECEAGEFMLVLDFDYSGNTNEFFDYIIYDQFNEIIAQGFSLFAQLPFSIEIANTDSPYFVVSIFENDNDGCFVTGDFGNPCFEDSEECQMTTLDFGQNPACEDGLIVTEWLIDGINISEVGFDIFINGEFQLFVEYDQGNWYDFDIEAPNTEFFSISVCDNDNADCCIDWELENPCYEGEDECEISNLVIETSECEAGEFMLVLDFDYSGNTNEFFDYIIYDQFNEIIAQGFSLFAQLPFSIEIANTDSPYFVVSIFENDNDGCFVTGDFGNPCFEDSEECQMTTLDFGPNPVCENGLIITEWLIDGINISEVGFDIFINGEFQLFVEYDQGNWYDFDIEAPNTEFFSISVCDNDNADCCIDWELENPCYEPPAGDCWIDDVTAIVIACEDNVFDIQIDFDYENTSDQFMINGNGNNYGIYSYADLPITLIELEADCTTDFEFVIQDLNDNNCTSGMEYGTICCEDFNNIQQININNTIDESNININVDVIISLLSGCEIEVFIDGEYYTLLTEESTNFNIGPFDCESNQIIGLTLLNKCTNENTEFEIDLSEIDCTTNSEDTDLSKMLKWNQVNKILFVESDIQEEIEIQILSMDGRLAAYNSVNHSELKINLDHILTGIYIVRIIDRKSNKVGLKKIFVH